MTEAATERWDAVVVGAGPAGLAAATLLAEHRARVLLLDEQPEPGGQIYRGIERAAPGGVRARILGADYMHGAGLVGRFRASSLAYQPQTSLWHVTPDLELFVSRGGVAERLRASQLILATGAMERAVPVPGWTLPGVMTAGALQILIKGSTLVPDRPVVLAGSGPLFYLLANQCQAAGIPIAALLDSAAPRNLLAAAATLPRAMTGAGPGYLRKGFALMAKLRRAGIPTFRGVTDLEILGDDRVGAVRFRTRGRVHQLVASLVALHEGVIPGQNATRMLGCDHVWDGRQFAFRPVLDDWGSTSRHGIHVAGDAGGIVGARAAEHQGRLVALDVLSRLGRIDGATRDRQALLDRRALAAHLAVRPLLDRLYPPPAAINLPADDVIVCRCETVTAGQVRALARQGLGPNQAKAALRCGMGPCQGRLCGTPVSQIVAAARFRPPEGSDYYNIRPPLKPISIGEISTLG
ncbi:MAG: hypothetical protein ABS75_27305 [Pelagibacterium sp. SCN 63-23]|mgnify:CR=1 FL=1|nr:MAG: hypothetical protein ABS75_27305 [Pelagibacterium sp. SCN 63-23]